MSAPPRAWRSPACSPQFPARKAHRLRRQTGHSRRSRDGSPVIRLALVQHPLQALALRMQPLQAAQAQDATRPVRVHRLLGAAQDAVQGVVLLLRPAAELGADVGQGLAAGLQAGGVAATDSSNSRSPVPSPATTRNALPLG